MRRAPRRAASGAGGRAGAVCHPDAGPLTVRDVTEAERTEAWAARLAADAPELTPARVRRLRAILRPGRRHSDSEAVSEAPRARLRALPDSAGREAAEARADASEARARASASETE